jgi:hypothetical protein
MNKRYFLLFVLCMSLSLNGWTVPPAPQLTEVESISITDINTGWMMSIMPNGSGSIGFGSNPMDVAVFPKGTFSLQDIYSTLVPKLKEVPEKGDVAVAIRASGATSTTARYINRSEAKPIFAKAQQQSTALDKARFDALVKDHPIEPKTP